MIRILRRRITPLLVAAGVAASTLLGVAVQAPPAGAATTLTGISVVLTTDQCPEGGTVKSAHITILNPGSQGSSAGNTVTGLVAAPGLDEITGYNFCYKGFLGWESYWHEPIGPVWRYFSFNGERMYI
jgi:hypothetical protein